MNLRENKKFSLFILIKINKNKIIKIRLSKFLIMTYLKSLFLFLISGLLCYAVANPVFVNITCRTMQANNEIKRILTAKEIGFTGFDDNGLKLSIKSIKI